MLPSSSISSREGSAQPESGEEMKPKRKRAYFPRKRSGCLTCKKRHVRCDEVRPKCDNCMIGRRQCEYPAVQIPLREKRTMGRNALLPGELTPWTAATSEVVPWQLPETSVDPFRTLPVEMRYKSKELFHYFVNFDRRFGIDPQAEKIDCISAVMHDPASLRNTLLLASVHYSWNVGALLSHDITFLWNRGASIRCVNKWLVDPNAWKSGQCARGIATLCMIECCVGNLDAAEAHMGGLATLLDSREAEMPLVRNRTEALDDDLTTRYFILMYLLVAAIRSRLALYDRRPPGHNGSLPARQPEEALRKYSIRDPSKPDEVMQAWHSRDTSGLDLRLTSLGIFPCFIEAPAGRTPKPVNVRVVLAALRRTTADLDRFREEEGRGEVGQGMAADYVWASSGPAYVLVALSSAHVASYSIGKQKKKGSRAKDEADKEILSTFSGMAAAVKLYMFAVIDMLEVHDGPFNRLLVRTLGVLATDLESIRRRVLGTWATTTAAATGEPIEEVRLWLWKAFCGLIAASMLQYEEVPALRAAMAGNVRLWAEVLGVVDWRAAKDVLEKVAWPTSFRREIEGELLWVEAMGSPLPNWSVVEL